MKGQIAIKHKRHQFQFMLDSENYCDIENGPYKTADKYQSLNEFHSNTK